MNIPKQLLYTKDHEWIDAEGGHATIGITDWAQSELGDVVFVELPQVGDTISAGETFGTIEAVKAVSDLFAPVSGKIIEINQELESDPMVVNQSPFEDGWMIKVELNDESELNDLLNAEHYADLIDE